MKTSKFSAASILILTLGVPFMAHSSVDWSWDWVEPTRSYTPYDTIIPLYTVTNNAGSTEPLRLAALLFDAGVSKVDGKSFKYAYQLVGGSLGRDSILPGQTVDLSVLGFMPNLRNYPLGVPPQTWNAIGRLGPTVDSLIGPRSGNTFNFQISSTPQAPKAFGLFVGVHDSGGSGGGRIDLRGDLAAHEMASVFTSKGNVAKELTADATVGGVISKAQIEQALADLRGQMRKGDSLVIYLNGHGTSSVAPYSGEGDDGINFGATFYDKDLFQALSQFDVNGDFRKLTFIDACHAGGFWGPGDVVDAVHGDLDHIKNIALFASAAEYKNMYYGRSGIGFYTQALLDVFNLGLYDMNATALSAYLETSARYYALTGGAPSEDPVFYTGGLGDPVAADPTLIQPMYTTSVDFDRSAPILSVPEPQTYMLMAAGIVVVSLGARRWRMLN